MSVKIGNARYGGEFKKRNFWKLKDGSATYRILPPLGELADKGRWSVYYNIHYGYKNSKDKMRVFQSPLVKNNKTKMIEVPDAALERIQYLSAQLDEAKKANNESLVKSLLKFVGGPKSQFNLDSHHYLNVMDTQGNIGILKLRHKAKQALDAAIKVLREKGVDPLSVEDGRFFVFHRTGKGLDTTFTVNVLTESLNIEGVGQVERPVTHKLTADLIDRLGTEAAELDKLFKRPTAEEVARIVKEGSKAVDEILDTKDTSDADDSAATDGPAEEDHLAASAAAVTGTAAVNNTVPTTAQTTPNLTPPLHVQSAPTPMATVQIPVGATLAVDRGIATVIPAAQASAPVATTTAKALDEMSIDEFLATLNPTNP